MTWIPLLLFHVAAGVSPALRRSLSAADTAASTAVSPRERTPFPIQLASVPDTQGRFTSQLYGLSPPLCRRLTHLQLRAHSLNLRSLLFELRWQNVHPFLLLRDGCLQPGNDCLLLLDFLVLFEQLVRGKRMAHRGDAKLAVSIYDNRVTTGDWYTRNAGDKADVDELGIAGGG